MNVEITFPVWSGLKQQTAVIEFDDADFQDEIAEAVGDNVGWDAEEARQRKLAEILTDDVSVSIIR